MDIELKTALQALTSLEDKLKDISQNESENKQTQFDLATIKIALKYSNNND